MRSRPKIATSRRATRLEEGRSRRSWKGARRARAAARARRARSRRRRRLLQTSPLTRRRGRITDESARVLAVSGRRCRRARRRSNYARGRSRVQGPRRGHSRPGVRESRAVLNPAPRVVQDEGRISIAPRRVVRAPARPGPLGNCARFSTRRTTTGPSAVGTRRGASDVVPAGARRRRVRYSTLRAAPAVRSQRMRPRFSSRLLQIKARRVEGRHRVVLGPGPLALRLSHVLVLEGRASAAPRFRCPGSPALSGTRGRRWS